MILGVIPPPKQEKKKMSMKIPSTRDWSLKVKIHLLSVNRERIKQQFGNWKLQNFT